jgi:hypothetical protein
MKPGQAYAARLAQLPDAAMSQTGFFLAHLAQAFIATGLRQLRQRIYFWTKRTIAAKLSRLLIKKLQKKALANKET